MAQGPGSTRQNNGPFVVGGFYNATPFTLVDEQACALQLDINGNLKVAFSGTIQGGNAAAGPTGAPVPADADFLGVNVGGTLEGVTGFSLGSTVSVAVSIVDGAGNPITSFGGGIQFPDNAASGPTPTGTLMMGWDSANSKIRALKVDANQNLLVDTVISSTAPVALLVPVSTSSVQVLASNVSRKGCNLTNLSFSTICLSFGGNAAVLFSGVTLGPGGTFWMDSQDFTTDSINAIASDTEGNLAIQEFD